MNRRPWVVLILILTLLGCASNSGKITDSSPENPEPIEEINQELEIGRQIHAEIMSTFYAYTDRNTVAYVREIGESLTKHAERALPYHFTILYNDEIYATSAPGGYVYLTTGMINFLENESELAAVMAHEIGQLQKKDPKLAGGRNALKMITKGGTMVAPVFGQIGALAALGLVLVDAAVESSRSTPEELAIKADAKAMKYMTESGYDPQGLIDVLYKFLNSNKDLAPYFYDYYQSRPITEDRFEFIQKEFSGLPLEGKTFDTNRENFERTTKGIRQIYRT